MINCQRCGKENQDVYKFCLGCGAELSKDAGGPPKQAPPKVGMMKTMMADVKSAESTPAKAPARKRSVGSGLAVAPTAHPAKGSGFPPPPKPVSAPAASGERICAECSNEVPPTFKFCGVCGTKFDEMAAAAPAAGPTATTATDSARLTLIRPDGSEGGEHALVPGENLVGRDHGDIFATDGYLSPTHATFQVNSNGTVTLRDHDSLNGVFVRMTAEEELRPGRIIRVGQELLRFDLISPPAPLEDGTEIMGSPNPGYWGKLTVIIGKDVDGSAYPLLGETVTIGRERGDINFPDDGYVSGVHAQVSVRGGRAYLKDLGSSNGTFLRLNEDREVPSGSFILLGQQLFRFTAS